MTIEAAAILIFLVLDPLGNIPFFLTALSNVDVTRRVRVVLRELLIAYGIMVFFLFLGPQILGLLNISDPALTISGGVVLFLISLRMTFPQVGRGYGEAVEGEPFIVPLAVPYIAGPSVLATEMLLMSREPARWGSWLIAISIAWLGTALVLLLASHFGARLSRRVLLAVERLMGMVLAAIAIQMMLAGLQKYLAQLNQPPML